TRTGIASRNTALSTESRSGRDSRAARPTGTRAQWRAAGRAVVRGRPDGSARGATYVLVCHYYSTTLTDGHGPNLPAALPPARRFRPSGPREPATTPRCSARLSPSDHGCAWA